MSRSVWNLTKMRMRTRISKAMMALSVCILQPVTFVNKFRVSFPLRSKKTCFSIHESKKLEGHKVMLTSKLRSSSYEFFRDNWAIEWHQDQVGITFQVFTFILFSFIRVFEHLSTTAVE